MFSYIVGVDLNLSVVDVDKFSASCALDQGAIKFNEFLLAGGFCEFCSEDRANQSIKLV